MLSMLKSPFVDLSYGEVCRVIMTLASLVDCHVKKNTHPKTRSAVSFLIFMSLSAQRATNRIAYLAEV